MQESSAQWIKYGVHWDGTAVDVRYGTRYLENAMGAFNDVARQEQGELVWPDLDVDPNNITGIENPSHPRN